MLGKVIELKENENIEVTEENKRLNQGRMSAKDNEH